MIQCARSDNAVKKMKQEREIGVWGGKNIKYEKFTYKQRHGEVSE
jgi:hypothetical protein